MIKIKTILFLVVFLLVLCGANCGADAYAKDTTLMVKDPFLCPLEAIVAKRKIHIMPQEKSVNKGGDNRNKALALQDKKHNNVLPPSQLHIKGILWQGRNGLVILDDGIFKVGDKYKGCIVLSIKDSEVILRCGEQKYEYSMSSKMY